MTARPTRSASPPRSSGAQDDTNLPSSPLVRWFRPDDFREELVLSGACELAITRLARELRHVQRFVDAQIDPPSRVRFGGPSGAGKTLAARWIGHRVGLPVALVDLGASLSSFSNATANNLAEAFGIATSRPSILFIDEIDAICPPREGADTSAGRDAARTTTVALQQLDLLPPTQIVMAATNFLDGLDPALSRRFTTHVIFELPDASARRRMITRWLASVRAGSDTFDRLTEETEGMSVAQVRGHVMSAAREILMRDAEEIAEPEPPKRLVGKEHTRFAQELFESLDRCFPPHGDRTP